METILSERVKIISLDHTFHFPDYEHWERIRIRNKFKRQTFSIKHRDKLFVIIHNDNQVFDIRDVEFKEHKQF